MSVIKIPCHPLCRRVILAEHGVEPVSLLKPDSLFDILAGYAINNVPARNLAQFTSSITLNLPDNLADHLQANPWGAAERLYRYCKEKLVWYVFAAEHAHGKGHARPAVRQWLDLYDVDEDEYGVDNGYKLYQREGWKFLEKNPRFSGQLKGKSASISARKFGRRAKFRPPPVGLTQSELDQQAELAASNCLAAYSARYRRMPVKLPKQVRIYAYSVVQQLSERDVAQKLKVPKSGVHDALSSLRAKMHRNPTLRAILAECTALPQAA